MIIKELEDKYYKNEGFTTIRNTVRGIVLNNDGLIGLLKIEGEDGFGVRNHYETPGGGVEYHETYEKALHRELVEELGVLVEIDCFLGIVISHYNLLRRINVERYYVCHIIGSSKMQRTESEQVLVKGVEFKTLDTWLTLLPKGQSSVDHLVQDRDYAAFKAYEALNNKR